MAKSKFEYVKQFEMDDTILPGTYLILRIDGRSFHKFTTDHLFRRPNDERGLGLMNACAAACMEEFKDIVIAYGQSDEYSFVLRPETSLFTRRNSKIISVIVSFFASNYVMLWPKFLMSGEGEHMALKYAPQFDARVVAYPTLRNIRDYLSWRQADCHINNLNNTCFWAIVHAGKTEREAELQMRGLLSKDKNELLFRDHQINYNDEPEMFRRGSILLRHTVEETVMRTRPTSEEDPTPTAVSVAKRRSRVDLMHCDMIGDQFWAQHIDVFPEEERISRDKLPAPKLPRPEKD